MNEYNEAVDRYLTLYYRGTPEAAQAARLAILPTLDAAWDQTVRDPFTGHDPTLGLPDPRNTRLGWILAWLD